MTRAKLTSAEYKSLRESAYSAVLGLSTALGSDSFSGNEFLNDVDSLGYELGYLDASNTRRVVYTSKGYGEHLLTGLVKLIG